MNNFTLKGEVLKNLPNSTFLVLIKEIKKKVICYISGKMRINYIRINPGDIVNVKINKYCFNKGIIVYRLK
ncbi:translation initiation factor IF-1 [Candidatus Vidania fulgoroideorum]